jgi:hypothetical protein
MCTQSWIPVSSTGMTKVVDLVIPVRSETKILESSSEAQLLTQPWIPVSSTGMTKVVDLVIPVRSETKILESSCDVLFEYTVLDTRIKYGYDGEDTVLDTRIKYGYDGGGRSRHSST